MSEYVKICPKCGHHNPEESDLCDNPECSEFLGMVVSIPAPIQPDRVQETALPSDQPSPPAQSSRDRETKVTKRLLQPSLYLECLSTSKTFQIHAGHIVGQAHPTSQAHIQMSDIPNINFVSREHCQFNFEHGQWFVAAIKTATNPTYVNQLQIKDGERVPIKNGDRLIMANVPFQVRVIES